MQLKRKLEKVDEGKESADFWTALGGKTNYASEGYLYEDSRAPRLFQCSNASGAFNVEELFNFSQEDLDPNDVFLLDAYNEVYVWVGDKSNAQEKKMSLDAALEYVKNATDGRSPGRFRNAPYELIQLDTPVIKVSAGAEPPMFTAQFIGWNYELAASKEDPTEAKLRALKGSSGPQKVTTAYVFIRSALTLLQIAQCRTRQEASSCLVAKERPQGPTRRCRSLKERRLFG